MDAKNVFLEVAGEFGWVRRGYPEGRSLHVPDLGWPAGLQIDLFRTAKRGEMRIIAYFPDAEPWIIRLANLRKWNMDEEMEWPDGSVNADWEGFGWHMPEGCISRDIDLRRPDSITNLRAWIEEYSVLRPTIWGRILKFFGKNK